MNESELSNHKDLITRPLFEEPDAQCERDDELSYPKGVFIGGLSSLAEKDSFWKYAFDYFLAAEAVVDLVIKNDIPDYIGQNPILYLYRHAIELYLKAIIQDQGNTPPDNEHSLHVLANQISDLDPWALKRIQEINTIDPKSTLLRYGGEESPEEKWAELHFLRDAMRALRDHLDKMTESVK